MSNKKTLKRIKGKNSRRGKSRKGGFFGWFKKKNEDKIDYDYSTMDSKYLQTLYEKDCKKHFGFIKNMSSKCRKINKEIQKKSFEERSKPQINKYTPVNQGETDSETDDEYDELPPVNLVERDPYAPYSSIEHDDEQISGIDYRTQQALTGNKPIYGYGGKRRRTKKHFRKRSIGKRSIGKRSIGKRSIGKRSSKKQTRRKTRKY